MDAFASHPIPAPRKKTRPAKEKVDTNIFALRMAPDFPSILSETT